MNKLLYLAAFAVGGAIGALGMYKYSENKFEARYQEDLASVKEAFSERKEKAKEKTDEEEQVITESTDGQGLDLTKILPQSISIGNITTGSLMDDNAYRDYLKNMMKEQQIDQDDDEEAYTISPEEFGDDNDYEKITLYYFQGDDTLTDDMYVMIEDPESLIGSALEHFGEYEEDVVYVRNVKMKGDYEILLDTRKYVDFIRNDAYLSYIHGHETEEE